jgi:hypothetical protein
MRTFVAIAVILVWLAAPAYAQGPGAGDPTIIWSKVVARAWTEPAFKAKLLSDAHAALAEFGLKVRDDTKLKVVEDTPDTKHVVLPAAPDNASELSEDELEKLFIGSQIGLSLSVGSPSGGSPEVADDAVMEEDLNDGETSPTK